MTYKVSSGTLSLYSFTEMTLGLLDYFHAFAEDYTARFLNVVRVDKHTISCVLVAH